MRVQHYQKDLAYLHDAGFGDFSRNAAPGYVVHGAKPAKNLCEGRNWAIQLKKGENRRRKETLTRTMTIYRKVGFKVKLMRGYGKLRFRKAVVGVLAAKP